MKTFRTCLCFAVVALCARTAHAIPISVVGEVDHVRLSTDLPNSGEQTEAQWIAGVLGVSVSTLDYVQFDNSGGQDNSWLAVDGNPNLWAFDFQSAGVTNPLVFLVNLGNATDTHYLFDNVASLRYGVIDLGQFDARRGQISITSVSHTGAAGTASIPEPASLSLVLLGLAAAGAAYRKNRRN